MARLTRVHQKVFASNASNNGVFGSLQAGNPQTSNDVATLQSLSAFENGWDDAIEQGDKLPPLEEFQGIQYGISYQQAYMLQEGIAEWDANTTYYKGGLVKTISGTSFKLYCSLADNNTNHTVTNTTYWQKVMDSDDAYAYNSAVVHNTGNETIAGTKTFSSTISGSISGNAGTVTNGVYTTGTQTISGNKTFSGTNTFSGSNTVSGSIALGSSATVTAPSVSDNSTKVPSTAWANTRIQDKLSYDKNNIATVSQSTITGTGYEAPSNGFLYISGSNDNSPSIIFSIDGVNVAQQGYMSTDLTQTNTFYLKKGSLFKASKSFTGGYLGKFVPLTD